LRIVRIYSRLPRPSDAAEGATLTAVRALGAPKHLSITVLMLSRKVSHCSSAEDEVWLLLVDAII
jgi:hypothetical protein